MKHWEEFINTGIVKKQAPNKARALSLIEEAGKKKEFLHVSLESIPPAKMNANFVVDYGYDIMMELIRAKMFLDGFNAGNSHEAEVSYLRKLNFPEASVQFLNEMRYYRNGTKYYGTILPQEYAQRVLEFTNKLYPQLKELFK